MNDIKSLNFNLGIPNLIPEWKAFFTTKYLSNDLIAGITVAFVAIPLSLAIALASGVSPGTGLVTAIIAGIVCALFGGSTLSVSGPAAAMSVLIADIVQKFGFETLVLIGLITGIMQLLSGIVGLGKLARYVPLPVISGFTAGIGVIILIGQLPRAFGLAPPPESSILSVFTYIGQNSALISYHCLFLIILTLVIIRGLPFVLPKIPPILPAVIIASLITYFFGFSDVPLIGNIPRTLPTPQLPQWPKISMNELALNSFVIYLLASLETLLSTTAIDKLTNEKKHNANQELIGQGLGNIAVSLFQGIPVTSVIARSATNVKAGAKTRRSSIFHSIILLLAVVALAPIISYIPIVALAGVLFSVAIAMINVKEFYELWVTSRPEALIYAVTFVTIIFVDLIAGVQAGLIAASIILLLKATKTTMHITSSTRDNVIRLTITGSLTFLSSGNMAELEDKLKDVSPGQMVLLDLSSATTIDSSGAAAIIDLFNLCKERNIIFYIKGLPRQYESMFRVCGGSELIDNFYVVSEHELRKKEKRNVPHSSIGRLVHGVLHYYEARKTGDSRLYEAISHSQDPHTLFITCSDSRIIPSMMTSSDPGELFIVRNVGNVVPLYKDNVLYSEDAAVEFCLNTFDIADIVICGHANCGAIKACQEFESMDLAPKLKQWISMMRGQLIEVDPQLAKTPPSIASRLNVLNQIENLKSHPVVQKRLAKNHLKIHGWFYDIEQHIIFEWDEKKNFFRPVSETIE